jgi:hypothetical protein
MRRTSALKIPFRTARRKKNTHPRLLPCFAQNMSGYRVNINVCTDVSLTPGLTKDVLGVKYCTTAINPLSPELNPSAQCCLTRFLLGILLLEPCISLIYALKTTKYTNYPFSLLIMYGSSYMFRHYIAIFRERT